MSKIYIVTTGEYSNYYIDAVFDNLEQAALYCAAYGGHDDMCDDPQIEEHELNEIGFKGEVYYGAYFYGRVIDNEVIVSDLSHKYSLYRINEDISVSGDKRFGSNIIGRSIKGVIPVDGYYDSETLKKIIVDRLSEYFTKQDDICV